LAEGLFAASASGQSFQGGYSNCSEKSHDANDGEEFDEGEGKLLTQRTQRSGRGDLIWEVEMRNSEFENREEWKAAAHCGLSELSVKCRNRLTQRTGSPDAGTGCRRRGGGKGDHD